MRALAGRPQWAGGPELRYPLVALVLYHHGAQDQREQEEEVVITVSGPITQEMIMHVAEYLRYRQLVGKSKATLADVDRLATEVKRSKARKRRERLAS